jgi:hypothetical protein
MTYVEFKAFRRALPVNTDVVQVARLENRRQSLRDRHWAGWQTAFRLQSERHGAIGVFRGLSSAFATDRQLYRAKS